ncbi:hypothetical protein KR009_000787, partial [Drosophila setifemur]
KKIQSEHTNIDDALEITCAMEEDLEECISVVERMNQKYNEPGRYTISMEPFNEDYPIPSPYSTEAESTSLRTVDSELDVLGQLYGARSAQELDESYVDVTYKFIKLKRDLQAIVAHCQRITDCIERQGR